MTTITYSKMPTITYLQSVILGMTMSGGRSGLEIRNELEKKWGEKRAGPGFYQLMARLEEAKLVEGQYKPKDIGGQVVTEKWYHITEEGTDALKATVAFSRALSDEAKSWGL